MKKLAVIISHGSNKKIDGEIVQDKGCHFSKAPIYERDIMFDFGKRVCGEIFDRIIKSHQRLNLLFLSKEGQETEKNIVKQVNKFNPDLAVELHANASTCQASGSEILVAWNKVEPKFQMVNSTSTKSVVY